MDRDERHMDTSCESPKGATHTKLNVCVRKNAAVCMCLETAVCCTRDWCSVHKENHLGSCLKPGPQRAHQDHTGPRPPSAPLGKHEQRQRRRKKILPPSLSRVSVPRGQDLRAVGCGRARLQAPPMLAGQRPPRKTILIRTYLG